jgi:hypothetical protein
MRLASFSYALLSFDAIIYDKLQLDFRWFLQGVIKCGLYTVSLDK